MNKQLIHINRLTLAGMFLLLGGLPSCMHDEYGECEANAGDGGSEVRSYVSLSFTIPSSHASYTLKQTKTEGPTGGEQGDGEEGGQPNENVIRSAAAFLYHGEATVNNSKANTPVTLVEFNSVIPGSSGITYTTESKPVSLKNGSYRVLVVANHPDLSWARTDATLTLGEVRDHIETNAWQTETEGETQFLMVSADEAAPLVLNTNPQNNPATTKVGVERVAARIDYKTQGEYTCGDASGTVKVLGAAMVNRLHKGTYLLKRVADDVKGNNLTYLGKEATNAQGVPTNYVLDPYTVKKTADWDEASSIYDEWFGSINENPNHWAEVTQPGTTLTVNGETWMRIGYTLENIADRQYADKRYNTGVVFKAQFTPKKVIGVDPYKPGTTFFAKGSTLFATMETMMEHTYGNDVFKNFTTQISGCADWQAVKNFASGLQDNDPSGYKQYLQQKADEALTAQMPLTDEMKNALQWPAYMLAECGYSRDANGVVLDQKKDLSTREALKPFGVRTYENGLCYYVWWVRHANDNDDTQTAVMEYAIVRNNVYKINVRSFYTLGGDVPGEEEPVVEVYVKDWTLLPQEDLPM